MSETLFLIIVGILDSILATACVFVSLPMWTMALLAFVPAILPFFLKRSEA